MCCGQPEAGPLESEIVMALGGVMSKGKSEELVELFTTTPGAEMSIGGFGVATNTVGVKVPKGQVDDLISEGRLGKKPLAEKKADVAADKKGR